MTIEKLLELIVLKDVLRDYAKDKEYADFLDEEYDVQKIENRFLELGKEFLNEYALNKTEKSEKNISS
jgi:hypothetical protein